MSPNWDTPSVAPLPLPLARYIYGHSAALDLALYKTTQAYGLDFNYLSADNGIGPVLDQYGEFARVESDLMAAYIEAAGASGSLVDVGANIGTICLPLAAAFADLRVLAVEANRHTAGVLSKNVEQNSLSNVEVVHAAVGARSGTIDFPTPPLDMAISYGRLGAHMAGRVPSEPVRLRMLDEIAPPDTKLVKIDVEGFEDQVLAGAGRVLNDLRPVWVVEANPSARHVTEAVMRRFLAAGYRLHGLLTPFVTGRAPRGAKLERWTLDLNFVARPAEHSNLWDLPAITDPEAPWIIDRKAYPYLARYA